MVGAARRPGGLHPPQPARGESASTVWTRCTSGILALLKKFAIHINVEAMSSNVAVGVRDHK